MPDRRPAVALVPAAADAAALVDPGTSTGRASLARGGGAVAPALTFVNLVSYALTIVAARSLDRDDYGELTALLGLLLVLAVPALALQAVVARAVARRPQRELPGARERALLLRAGAIGLVLSLLLAAASPLLGAFLHTGLSGPLWVAVQLAPLTVLSAAMGALQGAERFTALAVVIVMQGAGKGLGVLPLLVGGGTDAVLVAIAAGTVLAAVAALAVLGRGTPGAVPPGLPTGRDLVLAAGGLLAFLVLANLDLLLARNVLSGDESGRYSAGAVLAKAALWLPQVVAVVVFPRLSDPEGGRALLRRALLVVCGLGLLEVTACLVLAEPVLVITFGEEYGSLSGIAWVWAMQGAVLAVVQLLVYRAIATGNAVTGRLVGLAVAVEASVVLVVRPDSPGPIIGVATGVVLVLVAALLVGARSRGNPRAAPSVHGDEGR